MALVYPVAQVRPTKAQIEAAGLDLDGPYYAFGDTALIAGTQGGGQHMVFRRVTDDRSTRLYIMPRGTPTDVVPAAIKVFRSDYNEDGENYGDVGIYYDTTPGTGYYGMGMALWNNKHLGDYWGLFSDLGFSMQDGGVIPMRVMYLNHALSAPYSPMTGPWKTATVYAAGDYCLVGPSGHVYQTAAGGTSGATKPSHTSGSASDGGVTWTFERDLSDDAANDDYRGCVFIGLKTDTPVTGADFKQYGLQLAQGQLFKWNKRLAFANSDNTDDDAYIERDSNGLHVKSGSTADVRITDNFMQLNGMAFNFSGAPASKTDAATSIDVTNKTVTQFADTSPTSLLDITCNQGQLFLIRFTNSNTTVIHDDTKIVLNGSQNYVGAANETLLFVGHSGNKAVQIGGTSYRDSGFPATTVSSGTTADATRCRTLVFTHGSPASVTDISANIYQRIVVVFTNGNTTLVHNPAKIKTKSGSDIVGTAGEVREFFATANNVLSEL